MSKKKEYKKLFKNVGLIAISNFGSKILNILFVPLYTSILSTSEYGLYDIYSTISALVLPILTCNIADAVFRFSIDEKNHKNQVFTIGIKYCLKASIIFSVVVLGIYKIGIFSEILEYPMILILYFILHMLHEFMIRFIRGIERIFDIAVGGILNTLSLVSFSLIFLLRCNMGIKGYFYAMFLAYIIPIIYYSLRSKIWIYYISYQDEDTKKRMLSYSFPLIFDSIAWWVNNASDRYIVTWICGLSMNGIYSVAYKLPSLINTIQNIFNQAWMISAIDELKKGNKAFIKEIYSFYNILLLLSCSFLIVFDKLIAKLLFAKNFYSAWKLAPFLMIAVVFGGLSGFIEGIYANAKETKLLAKTTLIGAIINLCLNFFLVSRYGAIGAAFSTMISYFFVWISRIYGLRKIIDINLISTKDIMCIILVVIQAWMLSICNIKWHFLSIITAILILINIKKIMIVFNKFISVIILKCKEIKNNKFM